MSNIIKKAIKRYQMRKFKENIPVDKLKDWSGDQFVILFWDNTYKRAIDKHALLECIRTRGKDIYYIFDMVDRIILDTDVIIEGADKI